MIALQRDDIIIACSTSTASNAGIGIIRISGFKELAIFQEFFTRSLSSVRPRMSYLSKLVYKDELYDEVLFTYFKSPNSFSGENILEISCHGNSLNVSRIIDVFINNFNCKLALPGEFTYRAFRNKKLSFSQVEGLDLLLNASSSAAISSGLSTLSGDLINKFTQLKNAFIKLKAAVELSIDFYDDVGEEVASSSLLSAFNESYSIIENLYSRTSDKYSSLLNPSIALFGKTNAGKSTLFNKLLNYDRSIVSDTHGTTRDFVSEHITIDGTSFRFLDTAGIRKTDDPIERVGIDKSIDLLKNSFFKILLIDPFDFDSSSSALYTDQHFDLVLFTKSDLGFKDFSKLSIESIFSFDKCGRLIFGPMGADDLCGPMGADDLCGPMGAGDLNGPIGAIDLKKLKFLISCKYNKLSSKDPIFIDRHRSSISQIFNNFNNLSDLLNKSDIGIISHVVNTISNQISDLVGEFGSEDVYDYVFSNFCIGK